MTASSLTSHVGLPYAPAPEEAVEIALILASRDGCGESFRKLVEIHQQRIYHFCFHYLRDAGDAREASQDVFVRAHRALGSFRPKARFSTWLFQIALNLCRDRGRSGRGKLTAPLGESTLNLPCQKAAPDEAAMHQADLQKLDLGLRMLPEDLRAVLVLSCLEGLSHAECAVILKCSERAVEGRLYRARTRLSVWWEREGESA